MKPAAFLLILCISLFLGFCSTVNAEPNLISWWKFDEGGGSTAYDSAGDNDGTIYGATWTTGQIGGALSLDGNDYVEVNDSVTLDITDKITVCAWVKRNVTGVRHNIVAKHTNTNPYNGFHLIIDSAGVPSFAATIGGSWRGCAGGNIDATNWHHIAGTFNGTEVKLYIDGNPIANNIVSGELSVNSNSLYVGRAEPTFGEYFFDGKIDDVRIYDRALSDVEIWQLYREGLGDIAFNPSPAYGEMGVSPNVVLSWSPGRYAASHDVYFGTDYNDVNDANIFSPVYMGNFDVNNWDPCDLELFTTYYWRIDEVNDPNLWKGNVWNFTVVSEKAKYPQPSDGQDNVSTNTILSWLPGAYAHSHDVYLGTDYNDVNDADILSPEYMGNFDVNSFDPCGLELVTTYYWRIDEVNDPNLWKGDVWSFTTECGVPGQVSNPAPANGATCVTRTTDLSWIPGVNTATQDIYFGTDEPPPLVAAGVPASTTEYDVGTLDVYTCYYWRIDELNACGEKTTGPLWHFKTGPLNSAWPCCATCLGDVGGDGWVKTGEITRLGNLLRTAPANRYYYTSPSYNPCGDYTQDGWNKVNDMTAIGILLRPLPGNRKMCPYCP